MNKIRSLCISLIAILGVALAQCHSVSVFADTVTQNTHGVYVLGASSGIYAPASVCYTTDGSGKFIPCGKVSGGAGVAPLILSASVTNITASAVTTIGVSAGQARWVSVYNGTSQEMVLSTGTTGSWVPFAYIPATTTVSLNLYVPSGTWFGAESNGSTASTAHILVNMLQ